MIQTLLVLLFLNLGLCSTTIGVNVVPPSNISSEVSECTVLPS